ncbi:aromatic prenyltransferase [Penicillium subrubescens]|jgi:DMATS type aromatic prenyltransferase|uniref:7-dimethylallyltryptophan synthase n=1 Tax=Penicillium subrubescens TaxID=1316194 RepID=A0A1Q5UKG8_9EURO|nr:aromatic prenyltransferase [Penicillium subrubescens]KAJ5911746.1 aromatic prenyltransferase [Penicillium subrubescens]OKP12943.1 7-dimethylallyltryptophan synthase [Penicillium subrubescens]
MGSHEVELLPWQSLAAGLGFSSPDEEYWWTTFAQPLNQLMEWANYSIAEQYRVLAFLHRYVIPTCGPKPYRNGEQYWKTFMGFDHTPIQVSINFYNSKATVRTANIPICALSGSALDPINQKASTDTLSAQRHLAPGNDLRWFEHFAKAFFLLNDEAHLLNAQVSDRILAMQAVQGMLSYDFPYHSIQTKCAMSPIWKHIQTGQPIGDLMIQAIKDLGDETAEYMQSLGVLESFIDSKDAKDAGAKPAFFAFDTTLSEQYKSSRIKIYLATTRTALNRMVEIFTLGGRLNGPEIERAIEALKLLWSSVINVPEGLSDDADILPKNPHRCACVIFNFEIWPGASVPTPKIYLPAAYYGKPDLEIAEGMDVFFRSQGWNQPFHSYQDNYVKAL